MAAIEGDPSFCGGKLLDEVVHAVICEPGRDRSWIEVIGTDEFVFSVRFVAIEVGGEGTVATEIEYDGIVFIGALDEVVFESFFDICCCGLGVFERNNVFRFKTEFVDQEGSYSGDIVDTAVETFLGVFVVIDAD